MDKIEAMVSTAYLTIKFFMDKWEISIVRADQTAAHKCYNASLEIIKKTKNKEKVIKDHVCRPRCKMEGR